MKNFTMEYQSSLPQETIFAISTDIENFHRVMPDYFKSLHVLEQIGNELVVLETIKFLGFNLKVKTKHIIKKPNMHEIHILTGPTKGTTFVESYIQSNDGTIISISVTLRFSGILKLFSVFENLVANKMNSTMKEFIVSAEKFNSTKLKSS